MSVNANSTSIDEMLLVNVDSGICKITLNRPGQYNALSVEFLTVLQNALDAGGGLSARIGCCRCRGNLRPSAFWGPSGVQATEPVVVDAVPHAAGRLSPHDPLRTPDRAPPPVDMRRLTRARHTAL